MRKFTKEQIARLESKLESSFAHKMDIFEGWSDSKADTLLLESVQDDIRAAGGGIDKKEADEAMKECFPAPSVLNVDEEEGEGDNVLDTVYIFTKDGIELNEQSKKDQEAYEQRKTNLSEAQINKAIEEFRAGKPLTARQIQATQELREADGGKPSGAEELQEARLYGPVMLESVSIDEINESPGKPFRFKGKALKTDRINQNSRRYGSAITQKALQEYRASGQKLSIMSGHPKKGDTDPSKIVGSVALGSVDNEGWLRYEGTLSDTTKGLDLQRLLRDRAIGDVSLRSRGHTEVKQVDGKVVEDVIDLHFKGLDLVISGSETGAGVEQILNAN